MPKKAADRGLFSLLMFLFILIFGQTNHSLCHWSVLCIDIEHGDEIERDEKRGGRQQSFPKCKGTEGQENYPRHGSQCEESKLQKI